METIAARRSPGWSAEAEWLTVDLSWSGIAVAAVAALVIIGAEHLLGGQRGVLGR